jgi:hypothetical protein
LFKIAGMSCIFLQLSDHGADVRCAHNKPLIMLTPTVIAIANKRRIELHTLAASFVTRKFWEFGGVVLNRLMFASATQKETALPKHVKE